MQKIKLKWQEPLKFAKKIADNYRLASWIFLYSGLNEKVKNSHSYIALFPQEKIVCEDFKSAEKILKNSEEKWFGYLSYELAQGLEKLPKTKKSFVNLPKIYLVNFSVIFEFDHDKKNLTAFFSNHNNLDKALKYKAKKPSTTSFKIKNLHSNFSDKTYLETITKLKKMISDGDFYQTNLTRKFFGEFSKKASQSENFQLFTQLTKLSPANYSSFLKLDKNYILSSSPELFLKIEKNKIISRPIKGTKPRGSSKELDKKNKEELKNSSKEKAENLMIVDLVRNDLSRVSEVGSVKVKKLFAIDSYQNIHHMSSEIHGQIAEKFSHFDAIKSCFPPGSMTGAPKIKAIEIAAKKEKLDRGVYSGALGFISKNSTNLSVIIRTLILQDKKFEFQTGGAITFDSDPKSELAEIFNKAKSLIELLKLRS